MLRSAPGPLSLYRHSFVPQDEDEVDQGTMVRAGTGDSGTIRAAGSLAGTMIQHEDTDTMLGTLVISCDDEDVGTMKSKSPEFDQLTRPTGLTHD